MLTFAYAQTSLSIPPGFPLAGFQLRDPERIPLGPSRCRVRTLVLQCDAAHHVFVLGDFLYFPAALKHRLRTGLSTLLGTSDFSLICGGTHTHGGPELGFLTTPTEAEKLLDQIGRRIETSWKSFVFRHARVRLRSVSLNGLSVRRRRRIFGKTVLAPNTHPPIADKAVFLSLEAQNAPPLLLGSYASHPVFHRSNQLSAEYIGALEDRLGETTRLLLFQGWGGDLRPNFTTRRPVWSRGIRFGLKSMVKILTSGAVFRDYGPAEFQAFVDRFFRALHRTASPENIPMNAPLREGHSALWIESQTGRTRRRLVWTVLRWSAHLVWVHANAEVFQHYQQLLERKFPAVTFICSGCGADNLGYLVSPQAVPQGGYEVVQPPHWNGMDAPLSVASLQRAERELLTLVQRTLNA